MFLNLNMDQWKEFKIWEIFELVPTKWIISDDLLPWKDIPYIAAKHDQNWLSMMCQRQDFENWISKGNCIVFIQLWAWSAGFVNYLEDDFIWMSWKTICWYIPGILNPYIWLFLETLLCLERPKYSFGRSRTWERLRKTIIKLPVNDLWNPDREFMENYIKSLHSKPITTKNKPWKNVFHTDEWKFFYLKNICSIYMWNKLDLSAMSMNDPQISFIGRSAWNNWVVSQVDEIENVTPFESWDITVALWWSLWSSYIQTEKFYTSQNVAVLKFEKSVSIWAKLFITTCIMNESKYKYFPFWRELNTHIRTDFWFTLPVLKDSIGKPIIDTSKKYSEEWYIPDREYMENYIKNLPYGDRI